jgi:hypothetical protein
MSEAKQSAANTNAVPCLATADDALGFLNQQCNTESSPRGLAYIRHKVDRRILPFMFCCYFLQFIDKVMYNVSFLLRFTQEKKDDMLSTYLSSMQASWE